MSYWIREINGAEHADLLHRMNAMEPEIFPPLKDRHLSDGFWWIAEIDGGGPIGFAGMVPMHPFPLVGFLKRAYVLPQYRGQGLQVRFLHRRERKAKELGWVMLVTDVLGDNVRSQHNLMREGFVACDPEQPWSKPGAVYFKKSL